jgi:ABC-2 type transport system ATP-binding protein
MSTSAISIKNLRKTYREGKTGEHKEALKGINLEIPQGAFFALLGPNGAGKSTTINIMAGLTHKTSGTVAICGYDIDTHMREARCSIGVVPQELVLDTFFTVREALDIHAGYYGVPKSQRRTDEIIAAMGLTDKADVPSRRLSGGMKRRLLVAKALVHNPPVLVLDEPTAGVDVELRQQLWTYVKSLNANGTTILLTTHYLEEAEELCDTVAIIHHGEVIACDKKTTLMRGFDSKQLLIEPTKPLSVLPEALAKLGASLNKDGQLVVPYKPSTTHASDVIAQITSAGIDMKDVTTQQADLEDIFRHLTSDKKVA